MQSGQKQVVLVKEKKRGEKEGKKREKEKRKKKRKTENKYRKKNKERGEKSLGEAIRNKKTWGSIF